MHETQTSEVKNMKPKHSILPLALGALLVTVQAASAADMKKWEKGKGWGWVWGPDDEIGALNEMTDASRAAALRLAKTGRSFDLGVSYDRSSFKWPGHSPGEIMTFRSPEGVKRQGDFPPAKTGTGGELLFTEKRDQTPKVW